MWRLVLVQNVGAAPPLTDTLLTVVRGGGGVAGEGRWEKILKGTGPEKVVAKRPQTWVRLTSPAMPVGVYWPNAKRATSTLSTSIQMVPVSALLRVGVPGRAPLASQRIS